MSTADWLKQTPTEAEWIFEPGIITPGQQIRQGRRFAILIDIKTNKIQAVLITKAQLFTNNGKSYQGWKIVRILREYAREEGLQFSISSEEELSNKLKEVITYEPHTLPRVGVNATVGERGQVLLRESHSNAIRMLFSQNPALRKEILFIRVR